ncbi:MAG: penicillin-insensitive murein endopeptidase [Bdellovibrionota bacterium]
MKQFILIASLFLSSYAYAQLPDETELAPLLDLKSGGISTGAAQGSGETTGGLIDASLLPGAGEGFTGSRSERSRWGSGMMISMLVNSASVFQQEYPGTVLKVGGISIQHGGTYSPHKSHQNGLDVDISFVGQTKYESVLDAEGNVTAKFDLERNWDYWRLITSQQILVKGKIESAVSMILVDPRIKTHLCEQMKAGVIPQEPLDLEVMKRLRPTVAHDDHFHVRLKCSPYYSQCISSRDYFKGTGCE